MTEHSELLPNLLDEDAFEVQMRGYSRRQVDEFVARTRSQTRDLEERLARALDNGEQLRQQLSAARQQAGARPPHEEISERIAQILKLADDEAKAQKARANEEISKIRSDAQREAEGMLSEAREKAERMLTSAQDQAENFVSAARVEADKTRETARAEAEQASADARKEAEETLASARSKAERMMAESTARSTAINDGAARRLELLSGTHAEAARRLTEIRDVVTELLSRDSARGSLEDEVAKAVAAAMGGTSESSQAGPGQPADSRMARKAAKSPGSTSVTQPPASGAGASAQARGGVGQAAGAQPASTGPAGPEARPAPASTQPAPSSTGPSSAGPSSAGPSSAGPSSAGPSSAGPSSPMPQPSRSSAGQRAQVGGAERRLGLGEERQGKAADDLPAPGHRPSD